MQIRVYEFGTNLIDGPSAAFLWTDSEDVVLHSNNNLHTEIGFDQ